ncbi:hypothetical protein [Parabacteroides sp. AM08-6]|uniref:hypothetical protein n=1 Tax=Parabacteroides sp. AM08-6 TaxID=2292053 RepID=UPI000F00B2F4|nr:hypothetical protein [Parabacteroides sp. AM08-6]RHJ76227.1 hypothetical protein DW103_17110 [Parabacteroides sp. AM08-6]
MMWVEFVKSRQGLAYFAGDIVKMDEENAKTLIDEGFVKPSQQPDESDLPIDLPARSALIKEGLISKDAVLAAKEVLTDIKGIGEKTAAEIIEILGK